MSQDMIMLIKDWLLPPGALLVLLVFGLLFWKRSLGPWLVLIATSLLYLLSIPQTSAWLAAPLEADARTKLADIKTSGAGAILVFLAGRTHRAPELDGADGLSSLSLQRLTYAVRLHRATGLPLVLSGGAVERLDQDALAILAGRELQATYDVQPWLLETDSRNTRENAFDSARLLAEHGVQKVVLVTHAWHMSRARYSAESAGLTVIPAGTGFITNGADQPGQLSDWLPTAKSLWRNRNLLHEYLGLLWYRYGSAAR